MAKRLTEDEIARQLAGLDGWTREGNTIRKQFTLGGFPDAIAFVTRLAFDAEAADHHPDITINYKRVHARVLDAQRGRTDREGLRRREDSGRAAVTRERRAADARAGTATQEHLHVT
jgi:pterin-4a-carbinolamine dehydratase